MNTIGLSFDQSFDFDLVNNARLIPLIKAVRFKLINRVLHRAQLARPNYLQPHAIIEAILKNDHAATKVAATFQWHLHHTEPAIAPFFRGMPRNIMFRYFAVEYLVHPTYYHSFEQKVCRLVSLGHRGIDPKEIGKGIYRKSRRPTPKADMRFYALLWMYENPEYDNVFNLGKIDCRKPISLDKKTLIAL